MPASLLIGVSIVVFMVGCLFYGRFLSQKFGVDASRMTPAQTQWDGVDFIPAKSPVL